MYRNVFAAINLSSRLEVRRSTSRAGKAHLIESFSLYGGQVTLEYDEAKHRYRVVKGGRKFLVPSVTTACGIIAKPALIPWAVGCALDVVKGAIGPGAEYSEVYLEEVYKAAKKEAQARKSEAAAKGTAVHTILSAGTGSDDPKVVAAQTWLKEAEVELRDVERPIYSRLHRYSGRLDCIARVGRDGTLSLLDWKTGKGIYPEFWLQTAAYVKAWEEETGEVIEQRIIVRLSEDGAEAHARPRSLLKGDFAGFLGALTLYNQLKKLEKYDRDANKKRKAEV